MMIRLFSRSSIGEDGSAGSAVAEYDLEHPVSSVVEYERRRGNRFPIHAPAIVRIGSREIWAITMDVSTHGASLSVADDEECLEVGNILDLVIKIRPTVGAQPSFINGRGRIIRTGHRQSDETAIAVEVLEFDIQKEPQCGFPVISSTNPERSSLRL